MARIRDILTENLRDLRESRGWTQQQAADAAGVPVETYRTVEYGKNFPREALIEALAKGYGVDESVLFSAAIREAGYVSKVPREILQVLEKCNEAEMNLIRQICNNFVKAWELIALSRASTDQLSEPTRKK
jgi:transcriptional regulator with XRE-family HTH domain